MPSLKASEPHQQREVDAEDHLRHEDGGGIEAAPRPGTGRGLATVRRTNGAHAARACCLGRRYAGRTGAARGHRQGPDLPAGAGHRRPRPRRRVQRQYRPHTRARWPAAWRRKARRSRSSPSAARAATICGANLPAASPATSPMRQASHRVLRRRGNRQPHHRHAGRRRDRCLHPDLQPLPFGDLADRHRAAARSRAAAAEGQSDRPGRRQPTSSNRTKRPSWRGFCRRRWRSSSSARCWKAPPASTARA